jgi:hypothetical protein
MSHRSISICCCIVALSAVLASGASAFAQQAASGDSNRGCSNRTLSGDYGTLIQGTFIANNWSLRTASMMHFDGKGNVTTSDFVVLNGIPLSDDWTEKTGTYSVSPDCKGTFTLEGVIKSHFTIVNNGKDLHGVVDGDAITFAGSRVR